jgi:hypothetical protein
MPRGMPRQWIVVAKELGIAHGQISFCEQLDTLHDSGRLDPARPTHEQFLYRLRLVIYEHQPGNLRRLDGDTL